MKPFIDARIALVFGNEADARPTDALLLEGEGEPARGRDFFVPGAAPVHPADCTCCTPRNGAAMALARLILARGRGTGVFFDRVMAVVQTPGGRAAVLTALERDPIVSCVCRPG